MNSSTFFNLCLPIVSDNNYSLMCSQKGKSFIPGKKYTCKKTEKDYVNSLVLSCWEKRYNLFWDVKFRTSYAKREVYSLGEDITETNRNFMYWNISASNSGSELLIISDLKEPKKWKSKIRSEIRGGSRISSRRGVFKNVDIFLGQPIFFPSPLKSLQLYF